MDGEFGMLLSILDRRRVKDQSAVVFLSEQGNSLHFAKWTLYNAGMRSACIVQWLGMIQSGTTSNAIVEYVDIIPNIVNLTPDMVFQNTETEGNLFKRWKEVAETDLTATWITRRYQHRPSIELYDIENDRYCINNIAGLPGNAPIIEILDRILKQWMEECGDEGQFTEMKALEHQFYNAQGQIGEIF